MTKYVIRLNEFFYIANFFLAFISFFFKSKTLESKTSNLSLILSSFFSRPFCTLCSIMFLSASLHNSSSVTIAATSDTVC